MRLTQLRAFVWLLLGGFCLFAPHSAYAVALAESNLSFSNFQIIPRDFLTGNPIGTVELQSDWGLQAFAEAANSLGELDQEFDAGVSYLCFVSCCELL